MVKYNIPSMKEIGEIPWNGFNVVSTFSGCGGNSLGYRMAGFKVLWASEFIKEAAEVYNANNHYTILDERDIRNVKGKEILSKINMNVGDIDILDGSPPCASFSTAGKREKFWGKEKSYSSTKQRTDDLFYEYIRLLNELKPKTFIAENVSGLVKGKAKGYFIDIYKSMKDCGYNVKAKLLDAKYLSVPQSRERLIFIGIRADLGKEPVFPKPDNNIITLKDAFSGMINDYEQAKELNDNAKKYAWYKILCQIPKNPIKNIQGSAYANGSYFNLIRSSYYRPSATICQLTGNYSAAGNCHPVEDRKFTIPELKRICSFPDDFILTGNFSQQWERLGRAVPPLMMYKIAKDVRDKILCQIK